MRNKAIDMMRALSMVLMITVNDFWTVRDIPHWMHHAASNEDMMGLSDIVFPLFLFAMGMSIPYAIENKLDKGNSERSVLGHILTRAFTLLLMGAFICNSEYGIDPSCGYNHATYSLLMVAGFFLIWNNYGDKISLWISKSLKLIGTAVLIFLLLTSRNPRGGHFSAHWWGILGLIGWTYLACGLIYFFFRDKKWVLITFLLAFLGINILITPMNPAHNGEVLLDLGHPNFLHEILNILHMGNCGHCALAMGGVVLSVATWKYVGKIQIKESAVLLSSAVGIFGLALLCHKYFIIAKNGSTITWVLMIISLAIVLYLLFSLLNQKKWDGWFKIIKPAGTATLTCYMLPYVFNSLMGIFKFRLPDWATAFPAGLFKCILFALLCVFMAHLLGKINIKLKI